MTFAISLLIILATAAVVYAIIKTNPNQPKPLPLRAGVPYEPVLPDAAPALHWNDGGRFMVEVMTESRYQPTLKALAGEHGEQAAAAQYVATLMPDDHNAYENEAVAVFIDGRMVGYLSQKASIKFRELLRKKEARDSSAPPTRKCAAARCGKASACNTWWCWTWSRWKNDGPRRPQGRSGHAGGTHRRSRRCSHCARGRGAAGRCAAPQPRRC
jgi:hypothetical protein